MSESLITKRALSASIKQLMEKVPLAKISIQDIVDNCGLNRQTFYYHFKDKYDLVNWVYYSEVIESISEYSNYDHWSDGIYRVFLNLVKNKEFYVNALNTPGQNAFDRYLFDVTHEQNLMKVVNEVSVDMHISEVDKKFIADFYTYAFVGITVEWAKNGMKESPEKMRDRIKDAVDGSMLRALTRYNKPQTRNC